MAQSIIRRIRPIKIANRSLFVICILLSSVFWFFNALSKAYSYDVPLSVNYINLPVQKIPARPLLDKFTIKVYGDGLDLFKFMLKRKSFPLQIDFNQIDDDGLLYTNEFTYQINQQLNNLEVLDIQPSLVQFAFEDKKTKKVPLQPIENIEYAPFYFASTPIELIPNEIEISGPASIIDSIDVWLTQELILRDVQIDQQGRIALEEPTAYNVQIEQNYCDYSLKLDRWTEKSFKLAVQRKNLPDSLKVYFYPNQADLNIQLPLKDYETYTDSLFQLTADFANIDWKTARKIPLNLSYQAPELFRNPQINPLEVEFLIYK